MARIRSFSDILSLFRTKRRDQRKKGGISKEIILFAILVVVGLSISLPIIIAKNKVQQNKVQSEVDFQNELNRSKELKLETVLPGDLLIPNEYKGIRKNEILEFRKTLPRWEWVQADKWWQEPRTVSIENIEAENDRLMDQFFSNVE